MGGGGCDGDPVLDAVFLLFTRSGYGGFSMLDVAQLAGVPERVVTARGSRAELVAAALDHAIPLIPACPDTGTWRGDLLEAIRWQIEVLGRYRTVVALAYRASQESEDYRAIAGPDRSRRIAIYRPMFDRAVARGDLDADFDYDIAVNLVFGQVYARYLGGRRVELADADAIVDLVMQGLSSSTAPTPA